MAEAVVLHPSLRLVGRPLPRHDARDKAAAATAYAADWGMPGMLRATVLRSPYASARIVKLETPPKRTGGRKVGSVQELVQVLHNEAKVI